VLSAVVIKYKTVYGFENIDLLNKNAINKVKNCITNTDVVCYLVTKKEDRSAEKVISNIIEDITSKNEKITVIEFSRKIYPKDKDYARNTTKGSTTILVTPSNVHKDKMKPFMWLLRGKVIIYDHKPVPGLNDYLFEKGITINILNYASIQNI
jgi:hypothetical protein